MRAKTLGSSRPNDNPHVAPSEAIVRENASEKRHTGHRSQPSVVLQIVPRLPPAVSGVGDYALRLAREWRERSDCESIFLVTDEEWDGGSCIDGFPVIQLTERSADGLGRALALSARMSVLLHYVGYGYERRGAPIWLANGIREWSRRYPTCRTGIFFHELFAFGPPWTSAFWLNPVQRWVCRELARAAKFRFTNRAASAGTLDRMAQDKCRTQVWPVFSNLGEPGTTKLLSERLPQMVVYGAISRSKAQQTLTLEQLRASIQQLGLQKLISFGPIPWPEHAVDVPVENRGVVSTDEASALLGNSRLGYLDYFDGHLGKSGIFAAYCAHRMVPLLPRDIHSKLDALEPGQHYLTASSFLAITNEALQGVANAAHVWYEQHSIAKTARMIASQFHAVVAPC